MNEFLYKWILSVSDTHLDVYKRQGIPSRLWEYGGKSNQGFCNDDFGIDVFTDKLNDSRYQKTFRLRCV